MEQVAVSCAYRNLLPGYNAAVVLLRREECNAERRGGGGAGTPGSRR